MKRHKIRGVVNRYLNVTGTTEATIVPANVSGLSEIRKILFPKSHYLYCK